MSCLPTDWQAGTGWMWTEWGDREWSRAGSWVRTSTRRLVVPGCDWWACLADKRRAEQEEEDYLIQSEKKVLVVSSGQFTQRGDTGETFKFQYREAVNKPKMSLSCWYSDSVFRKGWGVGWAGILSEVNYCALFPQLFNTCKWKWSEWLNDSRNLHSPDKNLDFMQLGKIRILRSCLKLQLNCKEDQKIWSLTKKSLRETKRLWRNPPRPPTISHLLEREHVEQWVCCWWRWMDVVRLEKWNSD